MASLRRARRACARPSSGTPASWRWRSRARRQRARRPASCPDRPDAPPARAPAVDRPEAQGAKRSAITAQLVRDQNARRSPALHQLFQNLPGGLGVAATLDQDVRHIASGVDRPPEPVRFAADLDDHFIQMPFVRTGRPIPADPRGHLRAEPQTPGPDRLGTDQNAALRQKIFDIRGCAAARATACFSSRSALKSSARMGAGSRQRSSPSGFSKAAARRRRGRKSRLLLKGRAARLIENPARGSPFLLWERPVQAGRGLPKGGRRRRRRFDLFRLLRFTIAAFAFFGHTDSFHARTSAFGTASGPRPRGESR